MINLILAVLASYRLTILITQDDGPFFVFKRIRDWSDQQHEKGRFLGFNEAVYCAYCVGIYTSAFCALFVTKFTLQNFIMFTFAIAGGQIVLHKIFDEVK